MSVKSGLYEGKVRHRRFSPIRNRFQYRLFMVYLDLEELPTLFKNHIFWSGECVNFAYFRRRDHLGDPRLPLGRAVRDLVEKRLGQRPEGPIRLLTHLRYFGMNFNPVSFYYCYDREDQYVEAIVAEVHNTPWLEEHCYVFGETQNEHPLRGWKRYLFPKDFHVSPFMEMEIVYDWRFREPGESLNVHMINMAQGRLRFDATLSLKRREITGTSLMRVLLTYPLMTTKIVCMIYWQALRLLIKGAKLYVHPAKQK